MKKEFFATISGFVMMFSNGLRQMCFRLLLGFSLTILPVISFVINAQVPQGFNYQAIARDASGNPISGTTLQVRLGILSDTLTPVILWQELHSVVKTNSYGLFSVVIGSGTKSGGSAATFNAINWSVSPLYLKTEVYYSGAWKYMGSSKLWSVPYAVLAGDLGGSVKKLAVTGTTTNVEEALFEVKNNTGQTIFAVYNEGVRVFVEDGAKGTKGGFAIGGFGSSKAPSQEYLRVTRDSTRVYVNPLAKGTKGGFAIGGFTGKSTIEKFLDLTDQNYFIGHNSGISNKGGTYNSFFGFQTGMNNTDGSSNVFMGYEAGNKNSTGSNNVFLGNESGRSNITNSNNVFLGYYAGYSNIADNNLFLGTEAGRFNTTGTSNAFLGYYSGRANTSGSSNVFIGNNSGVNNTTGYSNVFMGEKSGNSNQTGFSNIAIGKLAGYSGTANHFNIFVGDSAGYYSNNTFATNNVFVGYAAGKNTQSYNNVFIGNLAGNRNTGGQNNIAMGDKAGYYNTSSQNIFVGTEAGYYNTSGFYNIMMGRYAGRSNTTGAQQILIGGGAGGTLTTGGENVMIGNNAGAINATGIGNVFLGTSAGWSNTGSYNVILGYKVGYAAFQNVSNRLIIDGGPVSTPLIWGEFDNRRVVINGVNIDNPSNYNFYVNGTSGGDYSWQSLSDFRLKKNINTISDALAKVLKLRGVNFEWKDPESPEKGIRMGFIAQEAQKVIPQVVNSDGEFYSMQYGPVSALLVEAIKEQQKIIDSQNLKLDNLSTQLKEQQTKIDELEKAVSVLLGNRK